MPKTPKEKPAEEIDEPELENEGSWEEDQKTRDYYYDDSHGYETYSPKEDKDDDD